MKKLLALLMLVLPVMGMENDVEYNKAPKCVLFQKVDLKKDQIWHDTNASVRLIQAFDLIREHLEQSLYFPVLSSFPPRNLHISQPFGQLVSGKLTDCIFLDVQYNEESLKPIFDESHFYLPPCPDITKKWHINANLLKDNPLLEKSEFVEMSWKYIDAYFHLSTKHCNSYNDFANNTQAILCKRIYKKIRKKGLNNTFKRIIVVVNNKHKYAFFSVPEDGKFKNIF